MAKKQGGFLVANTLYELGIREIFTLAGGHINPIYKACADLGINLIDTHHEQGAAMAADAYGRIRRTPGVCLVTAGPGFTNTLTGISGSFLANSPLVVIAGRSGVEENDRLSLQEIDQISMAKPVTKWARTIFEIERIPEYVSNAYKYSMSGRPGPVYLGTSYEVLYPYCSEKKLSPYSLKLPENDIEPSDGQVEQFIKLLSNAKKPVILCGSGSYYSGAEKALLQFVNTLKVPAFTLNMGRGVIPDSNDYCFGPASPSNPGGFRSITSECDLIILLGLRLSIYTGFGNTFNKKAKIVQVDICPEEMDRNKISELPVVSDINSFLLKVNRTISSENIEHNFSNWYERALMLRKKSMGDFNKILKSRKKTIHPVRVAKEVSDYLEGKGIIAVDGGDSQSWIDVTSEVNEPGGYLKGGPLGCMGVGIPFALGAKVARPDKKVVLVTGDGAVAMNFMEMETAVRHKIPFVVVICNDSAWGMTKHQIDITYPGSKGIQGVELGFVNFHEIMEAMGGYGEMVDEIKDLTPAIGRAFDSGLPSVINVKTDPDAVSGATHVITEMMMKGMKNS